MHTSCPHNTEPLSSRGSKCFVAIALVILICVAFQNVALAQSELPPTPACDQAQVVVNDPFAAPGELARLFAACNGDLLTVMEELLQRKLVRINLKLLLPYVAAFNKARTAVVVVLQQQVIGSLAEPDLADLDAVIRQGQILKEIAAIEHLLATPSHSFPTDEDKESRTAIVLNSLKELWEIVADILDIDPRIKQLYSGLAKTIQELQEAFE